MTKVEQLAAVVRIRGFDALSGRQRRRRVRELLDRPTLTQAESDELDVLLLMAAGLSEETARADLLLRKSQASSLGRQSEVKIP